MLAQYDWQGANRKRSREDEYEDIASGGTLGFTEHRSKRMQALPLRISDTSRRWPVPPTLPTGQHNFLGHPGPHTVTPSDSDSEEANAGIYAQHDHLLQQKSSFQAAFPTTSPPTFCMEPELPGGEDMDMMMDAPGATTASAEQQHEGQQPTHLRPGSLQPDPTGPPTITGRMPTPIQPSFAAQVRGCKNWSGAAGNVMATYSPQHVHNSTSGSPDMFHMSQSAGTGYQGPGTEAMMGGPSVSRYGDSSMTAASGGAAIVDWNLVHHRRLPSPISENGGEGENCHSPAGMLMGSTAVSHEYQGPQHRLAACLPPRASSAMEMGGSPPAVDVPPRVATPHVMATVGSDNHLTEGDGSMDVEAVTPSPPRKGHSRSRHTVNSWTWQPGMKKSFSIGYRADCEKCRLKVPGHFNHIIIS